MKSYIMNDVYDEMKEIAEYIRNMYNCKNQIIKEYRDKNKINVPYFKKLYLNIMSDKLPLFTIEYFNDTSDILFTIKEFNEYFKKLYKKLKNLEVPKDYSNFFVSSKKLNILSNLITNDYSLYKKIIMKYSKEILKDYYSFEEINNYYINYCEDNDISYENRIFVYNYFKKIFSFNFEELFTKINFNDIQNIQINKEQAIPIKNYLQAVLDFYNILKLLYLPEDNVRVNENYYNFLNENLSLLSEIVSIYNKTRNFVTKKLCDNKKIKLTFECVSLLNGWDVSKEYINNAFLFQDINDNKYYLGILNSNKKKPHFSIQDNSKFIKFCMKHIPTPNKNLPHIVFCKKGIETFKPSDELIDKYKKGLYKKGPNFDINFCHELIDFFKYCIKNYENYNVFNFKFKNTDDYNDISEFYNDVAEYGYNISYNGISKQEVFNAVEKEELFLFEIYNRHLANRTHSKNVHTEIFKSIFDKDNNYIQLCGGPAAEIFYRPALKDKIITHKKGTYIINKNTKSGLSIDKDIYFSIYNYLNNNKPLSYDAKTLLDSGEIIYKKADRDLIKDNHFTEESFTFHCPFNINFKANNISVDQFNEKVINVIQNEDVNILSINRGEHNLISAILMDKKGNILLRKNFNILNNQKNIINYKDKLYKKEIERQKSRMDWQEIDNISNLKEGYLSLVINEIINLMIENNAILVMEQLSTEFIYNRAMIERNIYQKFQTNILKKLSCLIFKNIDKNENGGLYHPYQLVPDIKKFNNNSIQFGWVFFINPAYISKICPEEAYVNVFNYSNINNYNDRISFLLKFKSIKKLANGSGYEFIFNRENFNNLFNGEDSFICNNTWHVWNNKDKKIEDINITETLDKAFALIDCNSINEDYINKIKELKYNLINNSAIELILKCVKICSEKKQYVNNEIQYKGVSWDYIAATNIALKMNYIISKKMNLNKYNLIQNIKTADYISFLENKKEII